MPQSDSLVQSAYARCDPVYLRELREATGMDIHILARNACLSVGQIRELESDVGSNFFYSDTIKRQAYKRVMVLLGAEPPLPSSSTTHSEPPQDLDARLVPLDTIADMSHRPAMHSSAFTALQPYLEKFKVHRSTLGLFLLLILTAAGVTQYMRQHPNGITTEASPAAISSAPAPVLSDVAKAPHANVAASAPTPSPRAAESEFQCTYSSDPLPQWTPAQARKDGRYVYLVSQTTANVCVVDSQKRTTLLQMKAGEGQSVYGSAPWQISGPHLQKIKVYFQGSLVMFPETTTQALSLIAAPVTP